MPEIDVSLPFEDWPQTEQNIYNAIFPGEAGENVLSRISAAILDAITTSPAIKEQVKEILADEIDEAVQEAVDDATKDLRDELEELKAQIAILSKDKTVRPAGSTSRATQKTSETAEKTSEKTTSGNKSRRRTSSPAKTGSAEQNLSALSEIVNG